MFKKSGKIFFEHGAANHRLTIKPEASLSRQCVQIISIKRQKADQILNTDWLDLRHVMEILVDDWAALTALGKMTVRFRSMSFAVLMTRSVSQIDSLLKSRRRKKKRESAIF